MRPRSTDLPLDPIETASRDAIQALQLERLKRSLAHAYENVPAYRAKFDAAGVHPSDLQSLADLADPLLARIDDPLLLLVIALQQSLPTSATPASVLASSQKPWNGSVASMCCAITQASTVAARCSN